MARKIISSTFTVNTIEDGTGVPYVRALGTGYAIERDSGGVQTEEDVQRIRLAVYNGETAVEFKLNDIQADATTNIRRGIALFAVHKSDFAIVEKRYYDTYYDVNNGTTRRAALLAAINSHKSDCYIALSSHDAYWWSQDLSDILVSLGGKAVSYSSYSRVPFAFVGFDGVGEGQARQVATSDSSDADPAVAEAQIAGGDFIGKTGNKGDQGADAIIILSGVTDIHVKANSQGISTEQKIVSLSFQLEAPAGTTANATSVTVVNPSSVPSGIQILQGSPIPAYGVQVTISKFKPKSTFEYNLKFSVTGTIGEKTYTQECIIPIVADLQGEGAAEWANTRVNNCGKWINGTRYYNNSSRQDFVYVEIPKTETEEAKVEGYVLVNPDNGSYVSNISPTDDVLKVSDNTVTGHWKLVSYNDIGFFGAIIATLVQAKEGQFDSLVAKDCLFDNITLTGVLNNLAQTLTYNTLSQYGYVAGDTFYINPLKIGQYVYFDWNGALDTLGVTTIYLPCVYSAAGSYTPEFGGYKANGERFTLVEMRQMVGKKIMLMPLENISGAPIIRSVYKMLYAHIPYFEAFSDESTENFDYDLNNFDNAVAGKRASIIKDRLQVCGYGQYQLPTTEASCFLLECKAGLYKDHDCVYWEITQRQYALIEE